MSRHQISDDARRRAGAARAARAASTRPTTAAGSEACPWRVGQPVRVARIAEPLGSWRRYAGRSGWVASINEQRFPNGTTYTEVGVSWDRPSDMARASADAWFRVDEVREAFL